MFVVVAVVIGVVIVLVVVVVVVVVRFLVVVVVVVLARCSCYLHELVYWLATLTRHSRHISFATDLLLVRVPSGGRRRLAIAAPRSSARRHPAAAPGDCSSCESCQCAKHKTNVIECAGMYVCMLVCWYAGMFVRAHFVKHMESITK